METYSALREYRKRIAAMLDDSECSGELLALGVALLDFAVLRTATDKSWSHYADRAWGDKSRWRIQDVLRKDIRRYDAIKDAERSAPGRRCGAPMIRRQGSCGASASVRGMLTDPYTGRKQWLAGCRRHREWFDEQARLNRLALGEVEDVAIPAANAGGVLARHFPEIDWHATWIKLDPKWTPPPEGADEETGIKPTLRLILGSA